MHPTGGQGKPFHGPTSQTEDDVRIFASACLSHGSSAPPLDPWLERLAKEHLARDRVAAHALLKSVGREKCCNPPTSTSRLPVHSASATQGCARHFSAAVSQTSSEPANMYLVESAGRVYRVSDVVRDVNVSSVDRNEAGMLPAVLPGPRRRPTPFVRRSLRMVDELVLAWEVRLKCYGRMSDNKKGSGNCEHDTWTPGAKLTQNYHQSCWRSGRPIDLAHIQYLPFSGASVIGLCIPLHTCT